MKKARAEADKADAPAKRAAQIAEHRQRKEAAAAEEAAKEAQDEEEAVTAKSRNPPGRIASCKLKEGDVRQNIVG